MATGDVLWKLGDPWKDLTEIFHSPVSVRTENGTWHYLDIKNKYRHRNGIVTGLTHIQPATPCGFIAHRSMDELWHSTNVHLVLEGEIDEFSVWTTHQTTGEFNLEGHPNKSCGALYCQWIDEQKKLIQT